MNEVKKSFIAGAERVGTVSKEDAEQIFGWIEKSARYAFNKSHSISYAVCSFLSAYFKAHHTKEFFLSYLYYANEKQDPHQEIYELISEAKLFDIKVKTPTVVSFDSKFNAKNDTIYFGVKDIKSLTGKSGDSVIEVLKDVEKEIGKKYKDFTWVEILLYVGSKLTSTAFKALASIGFFRGIKDAVTRNKALYDYEIYKSLTKAEQTWLLENYNSKHWTSLIDALKDLAPTKKEGGGTSKIDRKQAILNEVQLLEYPPYDLKDDPSWIIDQEIKFLGCPVSISKVETSDTSAANTTCKDVVNGKRGKNLCIVANVQRVSDYKIKNGESKGQIMSFLTIEDETAILDSVIVFPKTKEKYRYILYEGNNLIFCGYINNNDTSFIVEQIYET